MQNNELVKFQDFLHLLKKMKKSLVKRFCEKNRNHELKGNQYGIEMFKKQCFGNMPSSTHFKKCQKLAIFDILKTSKIANF